MWLSTPSSNLLVFFLSNSHCVHASLRTLKKQCWYQVPPFISVGFQSSSDGKSEVVIDFGSIVQPTKASRKEATYTKYAPWSHAPVCTELLQGLGSKLCVYTNASFSNGRGISIFTTPKIAEDFANLPAFLDAAAMDDINVSSGAWYTQELPGKGVGMLAKKTLKFGDRVTAYTPALLAYLEGELSTLEREKYFRLAVSQLPDATRDSFLQLATVYGDPRIRVQDIVKANTFQLEAGGQNHLAVFPETSRLNHACAPKYVKILREVGIG